MYTLIYIYINNIFFTTIKLSKFFFKCIHPIISFSLNKLRSFWNHLPCSIGMICINSNRIIIIWSSILIRIYICIFYFIFKRSFRMFPIPILILKSITFSRFYRFFCFCSRFSYSKLCLIIHILMINTNSLF